MIRFTYISFLTFLGTALAQRPTDVSICDYYTTALLKENNSTTQETLVTLVVNTAVIGNYTKPNVGVSVPGILAKGMYNGTAVNLLPYFDGMLDSSNGGGSSGVSKNFLDDGGAAPLLLNMPANGTSSNQYTLLTHLYEYFGVLLGCSMVGNGTYPPYGGDGSMYDVHKYMALDAYQVGYFITQVGLAASSFGVADADVAAVGGALQTLFGQKCASAATVVPSQGPALQAVCIEDNCPDAPGPNCSAYGDIPAQPLNATSTGSSATGSATSMSSGSATSSKGSTATSSHALSGTTTGAGGSSTGMAAAHFGPAAALVGAAALAFAL